MGREASPDGPADPVRAGFDAVADELYRLPPEEFTAARDARASQARQDGGRQLSAAIKKLRRPTTSAWLANALAHERRPQLDRLLDLGAKMRVAHSQLAASELRHLSSQRLRMVSELAREARRLADAAGRTLSEDVERDLKATLEAALADPVSGEALQSGRLTAPLSYSGLGSVSGLVATGAPEAEEIPPKEKNRRVDDASGPAEKPEGREDMAAQREAMRDAQRMAAEAERELEFREDRFEAARQRRDQLAAQITAVQRQLQDLQREQEQAAGQLRQAEDQLEPARRAAKEAQTRLGAVGAALDTRLGFSALV